MGAVKEYGNINIGLSLNRKLGQSGSIPRQESPARFGGETRRNPSSWHFAGALGNLARRWVYRVRHPRDAFGECTRECDYPVHSFSIENRAGLVFAADRVSLDAGVGLCKEWVWGPGFLLWGACIVALTWDPM